MCSVPRHAPEGVSEDGYGSRKGFKPYHSKVVPRSSNLEGAFSNQPVTTLMLRNIPNKHTQKSLMQEIDARGFHGTFDFFYLPMDVRNRSNVAYAFLNFLSPEQAENFRNEFHGRQFQSFKSRKVAAVSSAHLQGLEANLEHFEHRVVLLSRNDQYRPVVFRNGRRINFEDALKEVRESKLSGLGMTSVATAFKWAGVPEVAIRQEIQHSVDLEAAIQALSQLPLQMPKLSSYGGGPCRPCGPFSAQSRIVVGSPLEPTIQAGGDYDLPMFERLHEPCKYWL